MRVAVIGCGSAGARHARNLVAMGHVPLLYDADLPRATNVALDIATKGMKFAIEPPGHGKPDAVLVCTPADTHSKVAERLECAGYTGPLFVEKPLAMSVADAALFAHWPHPVTQVGYNWRFHPQVRALQHGIAAAGGQAARRIMFGLICDRASWPGASYADTLLECSHELDLARLFLGEAASLKSAIRGATDTAWLVTLAGACGAVADVIVMDGVRDFFRRWCHGTWGDYAGGYEVDAPDTDAACVALDESYRSELAHFLDCAATGHATDVPFSEGLGVLGLVDDARTYVLRDSNRVV